MRIAIVGAGIGGTASAWLLSPSNDVDIYESEPVLGGHALTRDLTVDGTTFPADLGFMVFNERTYPNLIRFFERLGVTSQESDMSFSVQVPSENVEWSGHSLDTVFAQRSNLLRPRFLKMVADIVRFSGQADRLLADETVEGLTLGQLLEREGYRGGFTDWYLIPMGGAIWSTPPGEMLDYPAATFLRFCDNHGLLHLTGKPQWLSVTGGSRTYVDAAMRTLSGEVHTGEPVERVERTAAGVRVATAVRSETYDAVIMATHPPETLGMLCEPTDVERDVLGSFAYRPNDVVLHTDPSFLPKSARAWASWNWYSTTDCCGTTQENLSLTYLLNRLQGSFVDAPVMETLNPHIEPDAASVLTRLSLDHPLYSSRAIRAQRALPQLQGTGGVWYAGAWTRYGFHEDGILSAVRVAEALGAALPWAHELDASREHVIETARPADRPGLRGVVPSPAPVAAPEHE